MAILDRLAALLGASPPPEEEDQARVTVDGKVVSLSTADQEAIQRGETVTVVVPAASPSSNPTAITATDDALPDGDVEIAARKASPPSRKARAARDAAKKKKKS